MTKIDFYVLPEDGSLPTAVAIGRLAEKASARGHQVFIQTKDSQDALQLDEALWAFRPSSFLPHSLATERGPERVIIGHEAPPMEYDDVLINLTHSVLGHFSRFERMAEQTTPPCWINLEYLSAENLLVATAVVVATASEIVSAGTVGDLGVGGQLLQQTAGDGGLSRTHFPGQQHEATTVLQPVVEVGEGLPVTLAHIEVFGVGRDGERGLRQTEELCVHKDPFHCYGRQVKASQKGCQRPGYHKRGIPVTGSNGNEARGRMIRG